MGPCAYISTSMDMSGDREVHAFLPQNFDIQYVGKHIVYEVADAVADMMHIHPDEDIYCQITYDELYAVACTTECDELFWVLENHSKQRSFGFLCFL